MLDAAPIIIADGENKRRICKSCDKPIIRGDDLGKDFETGWWIHYGCLIRECDERNGGAGAAEGLRLYLARIQHFRDAVIDAARCSRCGSPVGAECRELGRPRRAVHRQRIASAEAVSAVLVASDGARSLTTS